MDPSDLIVTSSAVSVQPTINVNVNPRGLGTKMGFGAMMGKHSSGSTGAAISALRGRMDSVFGSRGSAVDGLSGQLYDLKQTTS